MITSFPYKGYNITIDEANKATVMDPVTGSHYTVNGGDCLFYSAQSEAGRVFALTAPDAFELAKNQIDQHVESSSS